MRKPTMRPALKTAPGALPRRRAGLLLAFLSTSFAGMAAAEPSNISPAGFDITIRKQLRTPLAQAWPAIGRIGQWWSSSHSWSGSASNMTLDLNAGGCFCERWGDGNAVEHGRVVAVRRSEKEALVRLQASLGPFQEMPVAGVLSFIVSAAENGSTLTVTYRLRGAADAGLDKAASGVDQVIAQQADRLARLIDTGKAE